MRPVQLIIGLILALGATSVVRADLSSPRRPLAARISPADAREVSRDLPPTVMAGVDALGWSGTHLGRHPIIPAAPSNIATDETNGSRVGRLPPGPGSASLFLCALGTLGAWHLSRSAWKLQFGGAPEWFHTGAPDQIGHVVLIDPSLIHLPANDLDEPMTLRPTPASLGCCRRSTLYRPQHCLPVISPRGPPARI